MASPSPAFQTASCEIAGSNGSTATAYAAAVNPVTGKPGQAHVISGVTQAGGLACPTATTCWAIGQNDKSGIVVPVRVP